LDVAADDLAHAMDVSNKINDPAWKTNFENSLKLLPGFGQVEITIDQSELNRGDCTVVTHRGVEGSVFLNNGLPMITVFSNVVDCIMLCIEHARCAGYQFKENGECSLFSTVMSTFPDMDTAYSGSCAIATNYPISSEPTTSQPTFMPTTSHPTRNPVTPNPTRDITTTDESGAVNVADDDDDDNKKSVVIGLTIAIIVLIVAIMMYCAYTYGKNKKLEQQNMHDMNEFNVRPPIQNFSVQRSQPQPVIREVVYDTQPQVREFDTGSYPVRSGGAAVEGPRFSTGLEYLAAQPPIAQKKREPAVQDVETIGANQMAVDMILHGNSSEGGVRQIEEKRLEE